MTEMTKPPLLEMNRIGKSFSGVKVLSDVRFDLRAGEVHILAGENGAGKTTLIKILAGVHGDYEGEIKIHGRTEKFKSPHEASLKGISAIHQEMSIVNPMSVADNIFLGREITSRKLWVNYRAQYKKAAALLSQLSAKADIKRQAEDYPVSVRQLIEIAKALVYDARIIIMDEPTSALNDIEVAKLFQIIQDLKTKGCGIIYISHRMEEIYRIADRITVLRDGRYIGTAAAADLPADKLINWMVGRDSTQLFPSRSTTRMSPALTVKHFQLPDPSGKKRWAVEDATFTLQAGEILGIAGLQGSGKSELLHGLFGTFGRSVQGEIRLGDTEFTVRSPKHSIRRGLALLTNDRKGTGLVPFMNIVRNITLASIEHFSPRGFMQTAREREAAAAEAEAFDIKFHSLDQDVQTLSGGNQQKVVLAKWLETRPKVLLLDEPTIGVDVGAKQEIYRLMNAWTEAGCALLLITSELPELLAMSDRILVMHRGRIVDRLSRDEASQERIIQSAMGTERNH